jgi:hypothetical protein
MGKRIGEDNPIIGNNAGESPAIKLPVTSFRSKAALILSFFQRLLLPVQL